jgi:hypothetical protein
MELKECASWYSPVDQRHEINLRFSTTFEELEAIYNKLPHDSLCSLEFKNIVGLAISKEPLTRMQTKYDLTQSAEKICAVPSYITETGTRNISIIKDK